MSKISLCMIAYNEADMLDDCLSSAQNFVDEIIVGVDSRTEDQTTSIIACYTKASFFYFDWHNDFSEARNGVLEHAKCDWVLTLDADERLTVAGRAAIWRALTSAPDMDAFQIAIEHRELEHTVSADPKVIARDWGTRLFKSHLRYRYPVHEQIRGETLCQIQTTEAHLLHFGYDPELFAERHKMVRNLDILQAWLQSDPFNPQPNYYLAKVMFERGRPGAASTYAAIALRSDDGLPDSLSDVQKQTLINLLGDYLPT
jgi:glycosyltransferase involved in cell wall biosynthesis